MTNEEIIARRCEMLKADLKSPRMFWWLSFVDPSRPEGQRNLGCTVVEAGGMTEAIAETHLRGINPGGEVMATGFADDGSLTPTQLDFVLNKLRSRS